MNARPRVRLKRAERLRQLLDCARQLVADEGTDALSLGRLAEVAQVAKPVVYDHFVNRHGLLAALWQDFVARQQQHLDAALAHSDCTLEARVRALAHSHLDCVAQEAQQMPQILAALGGSAELAALRQRCRLEALAQYRHLLAPFLGPRGLPEETGHAVLGAAEALAQAAGSGDIPLERVQAELRAWFLWAVQQSRRV